MLYKGLAPGSVRSKLTDDSIIQYDPLVQPALLRSEIQSSPESQATIASARFTAAKILAGKDDRVIVIVGPCSIHSSAQALEYANLLKSKISSWPNLLIVMRVYFEVRTSSSPPHRQQQNAYHPLSLHSITRNHAQQWAGKASSMTPTLTDPSRSTKASDSPANSFAISPTSESPQVQNYLIRSHLSSSLI